ncbi:MAG: DNA polymerase [Candidatus Micrarchaeaceae archaeon]
MTIWDMDDVIDPDEDEYSKEWYKKNRLKRLRQRKQYYQDVQKGKNVSRPFVMWDGEAADGRYALFANSLGYEIMRRKLSTEECLDLILECGADIKAIHFGYGFNYDANNILADLGWTALNILRKTGRVTWHDYDIEHIQGKWFKVKKDGVSVKIFDVFSFYGTSFVRALEGRKIGPWQKPILMPTSVVEIVTQDSISLSAMICYTWSVLRGRTLPQNWEQTSVNSAIQYMEELADPEIVAVFKLARGESFTWDELPLIRRYNQLELQYGVEMQNDLREVFVQAGYPISSWHGPGSLARYALRQHKIQDAMAECPRDVWMASRYAYGGGRFEQFLAGYYIGDIRNADLNSAYPYAISLLPDLTKGKWIRMGSIDRANIDPAKFAIYHIRYSSRARRMEDMRAPKPLFLRGKDGSIRWPMQVEGWYWAPEAALVKNDPGAEFIEGWVFEDNGSKPFYWVNLLYNERLRLKEKGDPTELAIKLMLNSIYGQLAMRAGWERYKGKPPYHQLEWAGFITSWCKAQVYDLARKAYENDGLVSIDTDGIYSRCDLRNFIPRGKQSNRLGDWKIEQYEGILAWQSGFYWTKRDGKWDKPKTRGVPRGTLDIEKAMVALKDLTPITATRTVFIGYGAALQGQFKKWLKWEERPFDVEFAGSDGKRYHNRLGCDECQGHSLNTTIGILHNTAPNNPVSMRIPMSAMHFLPWAVNDSADTDHSDLLFDEMVPEDQIDD